MFLSWLAVLPALQAGLLKGASRMFQTPFCDSIQTISRDAQPKLATQSMGYEGVSRAASALAEKRQIRRSTGGKW